jgi:hypothetical protein
MLITYDTYKNAKGYWHEYTRDVDGNELTFKDSQGRWHEYTRDARGNALTFKNSRGVDRSTMAIGH